MERGVIINAGQCHRSFGIAASTASEILKRLTTVIHSHMEEHCVSSGEFIALFSKRSRETPARQHPRAEETEVEKVCAINLRSMTQQVSWSTLSNDEKLVYETLSDNTVHFDHIRNATGLDIGAVSSALMMLELHGLSQRKPGDNYVAKTLPIRRSDIAMIPGVARSIDAAANYVRIGFCGISRKNLQLYLAASWCYLDRIRWQAGGLFEGLFTASGH